MLVGRPNAGKSTLINALAGRERAVVSPVAGTTRDVLTVEVTLKRGRVRIIDVAGIEPRDETPDPDQDPSRQTSVAGAGATALHQREQLRIDHHMQKQALRAIEEADFMLWVQSIDDDQPRMELTREPVLTVRTKCDLKSLQGVGSSGYSPSTLTLSAVTGDGLDALRHALDALCFGPSASPSTLALNARHVRAIRETRKRLSAARSTKLRQDRNSLPSSCARRSMPWGKSPVASPPTTCWDEFSPRFASANRRSTPNYLVALPPSSEPPLRPSDDSQ